MALALNFSIQQGVSFSPGSIQAVGHLLAATISGQALAADLTVTDPQAGGSTSAAGVLAQIDWGEGTSDPISMSAFVSAQNQGALRQLMLAALPTTAVTVSFLTHEFDPRASSWYSPFTPVTPPLNGSLHQTSQGPELTVATSATAVGSASLYQVDFTIMPPGGAVESLQVAASATQQSINTWGGHEVAYRSAPG